MSIKVILNSITPGTGAKPFDSEINCFATNFLKSGGRLPHTEWNGNFGVQQETVASSNVVLKKGTYLVPVDRPSAGANLNYTPYDTFNAHVQVYEDQVIATSGAGTGVLVLRVKSSGVAVGATNSTYGVDEVSAEFISNSSATALTDVEIQTAIGADFFVRVADIDCSGGTILQANITETGYPEVIFPGGLDMAGSKVTGLATPTDPTDAVDYASFLTAVGSAAVSRLNLNISSANGLQVVLEWNDFTGGNAQFEYEIYKSTTLNGTYASIGTVASNILTFTDTALSANNYYKITAKNLLYGYEVYSNTAHVDSTGALIVPLGYYGDSSDGVGTGGTLVQGQTYNFSSVSLTENLYIDGNIILVDGSFDTNGFNILSVLSDGTQVSSVSYNGNTYSMTQTTLSPAAGGSANGKSGGDSAVDKYTGGLDGDDGAVFGLFPIPQGGDGATASTAPNYVGEDGQNGQPGTTNVIFGSSGGGASHGWGHTPSMLFVSGNYNDTGSSIIGQGSDGGVGGDGLNANVSGTPTVNGGHGGGGGQGGDGLVLNIKVGGTVAHSATTQLMNGSGGAGGSGGTGTNPGLGAGVNGIDGGNGADGANGSLTFI